MSEPERWKKLLQSACAAAGEHCPRCGHPEYYPLQDGRRRCPDCRYTYRGFTGRWLDYPKISAAAWGNIIKAFADGHSACTVTRRRGMNYQTVHRAFMTLRKALLCREVKNAVAILTPSLEPARFCPGQAGESVPHPCRGCRACVFSIRVLPDRLKLDLAPQMKAREVLASPVPKRNLGALIYTDAYRSLDALAFCCCLRGRKLFAQRSFSEKPLYLDLQTGFTPFAEQWLSIYRSFSIESYPLYLAEIVFRYNAAGRDLEPLLTEILAAFVPKQQGNNFSSSSRSEW